MLLQMLLGRQGPASNPGIRSPYKFPAVGYSLASPKQPEQQPQQEEQNQGGMDMMKTMLPILMSLFTKQPSTAIQGGEGGYYSGTGANNYGTAWSPYPSGYGAQWGSGNAPQYPTYNYSGGR